MTQVQAELTNTGSYSFNITGSLIGQVNAGGNIILITQTPDQKAIMANIIAPNGTLVLSVQINGASSNLISVAWYDTFDLIVNSYNVTTYQLEYIARSTTANVPCTTSITCDTNGACTPNEAGTECLTPCSIYSSKYCAATSYVQGTGEYTYSCYYPVNVSTTLLQEVHGMVLDLGSNIGAIVAALPGYNMFATTWSSCADVNVNCQVKLQVMDSAGNKIGEELVVMQDAAYNCLTPSLASNGEFLAVVASCSQNGQSAVRARVYQITSQITTEGLSYRGSDFQLGALSSQVAINPIPSPLGNNTFAALSQRLKDDNNTVFENNVVVFDSNGNIVNKDPIISLSSSINHFKMIPFAYEAEPALLVVGEKPYNCLGVVIERYIIGVNETGAYIIDSQPSNTIGIKPSILSLGGNYSALCATRNNSLVARVLNPATNSGEETKLFDDVADNATCVTSSGSGQGNFYVSCTTSKGNIETAEFSFNLLPICQPEDICVNPAYIADIPQSILRKIVISVSVLNLVLAMYAGYLYKFI